jgi:UDP-N-acetylglucosamine 2-epimerase
VNPISAPLKVRILTVMGTRPEAIKLAPVVMACQAEQRVVHHLCTTGQHREMLDQVLNVFDLKPDSDLGLMRPGGDLARLTADAICGVQRVVREVRPHWVVVQGDTTTAFAGALAAFYEHVPVAHVEAGLRTHDLSSPWPEELNRRLISQIAAIHFAPTEFAAANLRREALPSQNILVTGNTVIDALQWVSTQARAEDALAGLFAGGADAGPQARKRLILVTGHRRENLETGIAALCEALAALASRGDVEIVFPVHLNPQVQQTVYQRLGNTRGVHLIAPVNYLQFVRLLKHAYLVVTDSGGIQEEAPGLGKPVLVTRDTTERPEALEAGTAVLVGRSKESLVAHANELLDDAAAYARMSTARNPFGDGHAALRIIQALLQPR